jgi:hypothetical protein
MWRKNNVGDLKMEGFDIKPEDLGFNKEKLKNKDSSINYLKNVVSTIKTFKSGLNESLDIVGLDLKDLKNIVKQRITGKPDFVNTQAVEISRPQPKIENKEIKEIKEKNEKMEKLDIEKEIKRFKLIVKFMRAENLKVSEFIEKIEENKEDIKEILS